MTAPAAPVRLSLVSHTNVGKTTLARTLLGRDIGEVRDAPHVTEFAEMHRLLETAQGDVLELWDTPGFGDSARLARRLEASTTPIGWFLAQVWDRWRDRAFWLGQQAVRHVRDTSDLVLYLVNAAESPAAAGYVAPELRILGWIGKPVVVLLNQLGAPGADDAAEVEAWRRHLAGQPLVKAVLPLDAFARCWVQEGVLLAAVAEALGGDERLRRLHAAWRARADERFAAAMEELGASLRRIGAAGVPLARSGLLARRDDSAAQQALADALDAEVRASTGRLLALHGIDGAAGGEILDRVAALVDLRPRIDEGRSSLVGGVVGGALMGLKADLASGGLTLGGGMLAGGLLGALGGAGLARGLNAARGTTEGQARWGEDALPALAEAALLRYLAVAHFGRGRGAWAAGEAPARWRAAVHAALAPQLPALQAAWRSGADAGPAVAALTAAARALLRDLYPSADGR